MAKATGLAAELAELRALAEGCAAGADVEALREALAADRLQGEARRAGRKAEAADQRRAVLVPKLISNVLGPACCGNCSKGPLWCFPREWESVRAGREGRGSQGGAAQRMATPFFSLAGRADRGGRRGGGGRGGQGGGGGRGDRRVRRGGARAPGNISPIREWGPVVFLRRMFADTLIAGVA